MDKFIVAEISKNWIKEEPIKNLISHQFEEVINTNAQRGYKLIDWQITRTVDRGCLNETIIAVFELA